MSLEDKKKSIEEQLEKLQLELQEYYELCSKEKLVLDKKRKLYAIGAMMYRIDEKSDFFKTEC